jgi:hypothetical protein
MLPLLGRQSVSYKSVTLRAEDEMTSTMSGMPFQIIYEPGGKIRISGELTSLEQADEFIAAVQALKHLMTPSPTASHGPEENARTISIGTRQPMTNVLPLWRAYP